MDGQIARLKSWTSACNACKPRIAHHQFAFNKASIGKTCKVLVERNRAKPPGQWLGKSPVAAISVV